MKGSVCQSCGMPMKDVEDFGTNADKTQNSDYCSYCYKGGVFTNDVTMDEMIEINLKYLDVYNNDAEEKVTVEEARTQMKQHFPMLKRWQKNG